MIATGLAFGILSTRVIVRTLLVPALVAIMGRWNWWMPGSLTLLLRIAHRPETDRPPDPQTHTG